MCVIVHKPQGSTIKVKTLKACWEANPHGAGVMWAEDGKVFGLKGFMEFKDLEAALDKSNLIEDGKVVADFALTFHFRLATHGGVSGQNCHPFPISGDMADLKATSWCDDIGMAHNGVIQIDDIADGNSDTQTYISDCLSHDKAKLLKFDEATMKQVAWETEPSRLFILRGDGKFATTGKWFKNKQGVLYSNLIWWDKLKAKKAETKTTKATPPRQAPQNKRGFPMFDQRRPVSSMAEFMASHRHNRNYPKWS